MPVDRRPETPAQLRAGASSGIAFGIRLAAEVKPAEKFVSSKPGIEETP